MKYIYKQLLGREGDEFLGGWILVFWLLLRWLLWLFWLSLLGSVKGKDSEHLPVSTERQKKKKKKKKQLTDVSYTICWFDVFDHFSLCFLG